MYKSIRPGSKKGDAKVTDIRCLKYSNDGKIHYKLSFKDEFKLLPAYCDSTVEIDGYARKSKRKAKEHNQHPTDWHHKTQELHDASF